MEMSTTLGLIIQWGSDGWTGGPNYLKNIALAIGTLPPSHRLRMVFFVLPEQIDHLGQYQSILHLADDIRPFVPGVSMDDVDVLYPFPAEDPGVSANPARAFWIPDFQHKYLPHFFSNEDIQWREKYFSYLACQKNAVILSSQSALNDFQKFFSPQCPTYILRFVSSLDDKWIQMDTSSALKKFHINNKYIICCNQFWKHKDHLSLFKAINILKKKNIYINLVCTGSTEDHRDLNYFNSLKEYIEQNNLSQQIQILGLIDRTDQIQLLRASMAVVQPSLFEGWSTVVEDARMFGKTIIYSDIPVHKEQNPPYGISFQAGNPFALAQAIEANLGKLNSTIGTQRELDAIAKNREARVKFGLDISKIVNIIGKKNKDIKIKAIYNTKNTFFAQKQWYHPAIAGSQTFASGLFDINIYKNVCNVLNKIQKDDYIIFLNEFIKKGIENFKENWRYADICTVLYHLSKSLDVKNYLEIGVRQGRSMAMVASCCPEVDIVGFDMWIQDYAGMENPGPEFVRDQLLRLNHKGKLNLVSGNSQETVPAYFAANPQQTFDLITVDGDHSPEGATMDIRNVLPRLRIGGAIVFDDIAHPSHPQLINVWQQEVQSRHDMSCFEFTELGYGVAFAIRMH
jgi:glycosyltransferase involved in cell wall biosynthesis/predicted O-methyltransferase YrrM